MREAPCCCCCCYFTSVVSDSVQPHRWQPTRLPRPWDSPGKNTRVGCHFLLQCMKVKSEREVAQSCPTPSDPMDCSLPGFSVHGIFQARVGCHCLLLQSDGLTYHQSPFQLAYCVTHWFIQHIEHLLYTSLPAGQWGDVSFKWIVDVILVLCKE